MSVEIAVLAAPHPTDCRVVLAKVLPCPLSSSADGLRALLGSAPVGPEGGAA